MAGSRPRVPSPLLADRPTVLYVSHGHPRYRIGGVEILSFELFEAIRDQGSMNAIYLARVLDPAPSTAGVSQLIAASDDGCEILCAATPYDHFDEVCTDSRVITVRFRQLLEDISPDIVHVQHGMGMGLDLVWQIRTARPDVPIVYSLHEFLSICFARGHLVRTTDGELCTDFSSSSCHRCFPTIPASQFSRRRARIEATFRQVDLFLAPSRFLRDIYVQWGLPEHSIVYQPQGRRHPAEPRAATESPPQKNFVFLGQAHSHKGLSVLLEAMARLEKRGFRQIRLDVHGAYLEEDAEHRAEVERLLRLCRSTVRFRGPYGPSDLPAIMEQAAWAVVPSIWWENSPCVIEEAFMFQRPVICTGIGGMAEKVEHGVSGLHFRRGDADQLADTLARAATESGLWQQLRRGIPEVYSIEEATRDHLAVYERLLAAARQGNRCV